MLEVGYELQKKKGGYEAYFVAEENGKEIHREKLNDLKNLRAKKSDYRKSRIGLDKKGLTVTLRVINK